MKLEGRAFLVTGATGGIGRATAKALAGRGARVILSGRDEDKLAAVAREIGAGARAIPADLERPGEAARLAAAASAGGGAADPLGGLVNVAGLNAFGKAQNVDAATTERMFRVNVLAPMELTRALLPRFLERKDGVIVNVGSVYGSIGFPFFAAYSATKFALRGFTEALRRELEGSGVRVSWVAPRATKTAMLDATARLAEVMKMNVDAPERVADAIVSVIEKETPRRTIGLPEAVFSRVNAMAPGFVDRALRAPASKMRPLAEENS